jgi:hypothetical protein
LSYNLLRQFSEKGFERFPINHPIEFPSGFGSKLLKEAKIDIRSDVRVPCITAYEIIFLTNS